MLISDLTGIYRKHNLPGDLYNRAAILCQLIDENGLKANVSLNNEKFLEFTIQSNNKEMIITFLKVETLRCTINGETNNLHWGRYYIIPLLKTFKGVSDEQKMEDRRN